MSTDDDLAGEKGNTDEAILKRGHTRFNYCVDWESYARTNYDFDTKFANGDSINNNQWPNDIRNARIGSTPGSAKPCLTINKTRVHNLAIINDAKQNKPGVTIRPVSDDASYEAAQIYQDIIRHIEYRSNAENVYDSATVTQVEGGVGYWRVSTDYVDPNSFDQEILIKRIRNPLSVYLDPDAKEADGSDARFGFIYEEMPRDLYDEKYPDEQGEATSGAPLGNYDGDWFTKDHVRIAEYFERQDRKDKLLVFNGPDGEQVSCHLSELSKEAKRWFETIEKADTTKVRSVTISKVKWYKIAGNKIIEKGDWVGATIPIIRIVGTEVVIDGRMDRYGNTRCLLDPQRMYNYNCSNYVEMVALQPRAPFVAPAAAIEGFEEYWNTANTRDHSVLPYNHISEDGNKDIPMPTRLKGPEIQPAYLTGMDISEKQMMMASGQYQSQMGENENAKSGVAINSRQRQGDRITYHFIDNLAIGIRRTGKILIEIIPLIYDTQRILYIMGLDGSAMEVTIDPNAPDAVIKQQEMQAEIDKGTRLTKLIFNPTVGTYDVQSDTGPGYATRRQEAWNAFVQIASQNKEVMQTCGDLMFKVADFPMANEISQRLARTIPPNIKGDAPDPQMDNALHMASDKIEQMQGLIAKQAQELADKQKELDIKAAHAQIDSYKAESERLRDIGNAGPIVSEKELKPLIDKMLKDMLGDPVPGVEDGEAPPVHGAKQAPDGNWYVPDPSRKGKFHRVDIGGEADVAESAGSTRGDEWLTR